MRRGAALVTALLVGASCSSSHRASTVTTVVATTSSSTSTATVVDVAARAAMLQRAVDEYAAGQAVPFSVVAVDLVTGARAERLGDRVVLSASLYKLFVARELLRRFADGSLSRSAPANDGHNHTVDDCLRLMIVVSDNQCGQAGLRIVGGGAQDVALARDGYVGTRLASPQRTSARDVSLFLTRARDGSLLGPGREPLARELYVLLQSQQVNDRLPTGLPPGTAIAHKTGDRIGWAHDAGIVTGTRGDFLLAVLTGPWAAPCCDADHPGPAEARAFAAIAGLGRRVYETLSR